MDSKDRVKLRKKELRESCKGRKKGLALSPSVETTAKKKVYALGNMAKKDDL